MQEISEEDSKDKIKQESEKLLMDLLAIKSVNGQDDEGAVAEYLYEYLQLQGLPATLHRIDDTHADVTAYLEGMDSEKCIVWNGHLDTVPYGDREKWSQDPAIPRIREQRVYGRGASDMKSGLAAMAYALGFMAKQKYRPAYSIFFCGTCDEEKNGLGAEYIRKQKCFPVSPKLLLIGEPTGCNPGIAQKGCLWLQLTIKGKTSHGAYPWQGVNAIEQGMKIASKLSSYIEGFSHKILGNATAQVTRIEGGIAPNMTPDLCRILMDIRLVPGIESGMVKKKLEELTERASKENGIEAVIEILNERTAIEVSSENSFVEELRKLIQKHGQTPVDTGINYFTDASILVREEKNGVLSQRENLPVILFGPGSPDMAHKPDEFVELAKFNQAVHTLLQWF